MSSLARCDTHYNFVASPEFSKYGLVLERYCAGQMLILWEGHLEPYVCISGSCIAVQEAAVPVAVADGLRSVFESLKDGAA